MRRSLILSGILVAVFTGGSALADVEIFRSREYPPPNTLTLTPLGIFVGSVGLEYERAFDRNWSFFVAPYLEIARTRDGSVAAFGGDTGLRYFVFGQAPRGLWFGPQLAVAIASSNDAAAAGVGIGGLIGYTFLFFNVVDLSIGAGAQYATFNAAADRTFLGSTGIGPLGRLSLGVAF